MEKFSSFKFLWLAGAVACLFACQDPNSEQLILVSFEGRNSLRMEEDGLTYMPLVKLTGDSIYYREERYPVAFPKHLDSSKIAIAENYFMGYDNKIGQGSAFLLVYDYESSHPIIYTDPSSTFTFTEANKFEFDPSDSIMVLQFENPTCSECYFNVDLRKVDYVNPTDKKITERYFGKGPLTLKNERIDADHWFEDRRMNYRYSKFTYQGNTYNIGLYDYYCNGKFNDKDEDRVMISPENELLDDNLSSHGFTYSDSQMVISAANTYFKVLEVAENGHSILLQPTKLEVMGSHLRIGENIDKINSVGEGSQSSQLPALVSSKPYTLFQLWHSGCRPCIEAFPDVRRIEQEHEEVLSVVSLNYGNDRELIEQIERKFDLGRKTVMLTKAEYDFLNIEGYPKYLLLEKGGKLIANTSSLNDIEEMIGD